MPFYEYRCPDCMTIFDLRRNIDQRDTPARCPQCEGMYSARLISAPMLFSMAADGSVRAVAGASGCGGCTATSCGGCPSNG